MVEDRITDPVRIAALLAAEFSGLETGPLAGVTVEAADEDPRPSADGPQAFEIRYESDPVGRVRLFEDHVRLAVTKHPARAVAEAREAGLEATETDDAAAIRLPYGATVKRGVDALAAALD